jgi:VCBS repeat-containing protein
VPGDGYLGLNAAQGIESRGLFKAKTLEVGASCCGVTRWTFCASRSAALRPAMTLLRRVFNSRKPGSTAGGVSPRGCISGGPHHRCIYFPQEFERMRKDRKTRNSDRKTTNRKNFLRVERLEARLALTTAPIALNDYYHSEANEPLEIPATGILSNDTSSSGGALSAGLFSGPANGTLELNEDGSFSYTPDTDFEGLDSFLYFANDGASDSMLAAVTIEVGPENETPVATNDLFTVGEDGVLTVDAAGGLLANDSDADGDVMTPTITLEPLHGSVVLNADGSFSYTPDADFNGLDGFSYVVSDGIDSSEVASATIVVTPANDEPVGVNDEYTTAEDTPLSIAAPGVLVNDTDVDGDALAAILVNPPQHGQLTLGADGGVVYTPDANFHGVDGFSYRANDGSADSDATAVTIHVTPVADAPVGTADAYVTDEDVALVVDVASGVLANDNDGDGDPLTVSVVTGPASGALTLNADGSFEYVPNANFHGSDSFVYQASDGTLTSEAVTVSLTINPVNDAPIGAADEFAADEDTALVVDAANGLLANDSDADGEALTVSLVSGPANGALALNPDGSFSYTPNADFFGSDSFVYQASDGTLTSEAVTVTLTVAPINDGPVSVGDEYSTGEDTLLTVDAANGVLANDSDVDGDTLTATLVSGTANGELTLNPDGSFSYSPNENFHGSDSFVYQASDGTLAGEAVTVTIDVCPANDAPTTAAEAYTLDEDTTLTVDALAGVLANDSDIDGDSLTASVVNGPANGELTLNADGSFSYTPNANFSGTDSFVYEASDGGLESQGTVTLTINPIAEAPIAAIDHYSTGEDVPLVIGVGMGVLANDLNTEGGEMTAEVITAPAHGSLTLNPDGSFSFTPEANYHGSDSFTYKAVSNGQEVIAAANIVIEPLNDAPVAVDDAVTIVGAGIEGADGNVLANDSDLDGDSLTPSLVSGPANGSLTLYSDGSFDYTPTEGFLGTDSFRYQIFDGMANSNIATVTLQVEAEAPAEEIPPVEEAPPVEETPPAEETPPCAEAPPTEEVPPTEEAPPTEEVPPVEEELPTEEMPPTEETPTEEVPPVEEELPTEETPPTEEAPPTEEEPTEEEPTCEETPPTEETPPEEIPPTEEAPPEETPPTVENVRPSAANDVFTTPAGTALTVPAAGGLLANDADPEGAPMTATLFSQPLHGTVTVAADGSFVYTPADGYVGMDAFMYRTSDGENWSAMAAVTVYVTPADVPEEAPMPEEEPAPPAEEQPGTDPTDPAEGCDMGERLGRFLANARHSSRFVHVRAVDLIFERVGRKR